VLLLLIVAACWAFQRGLTALAGHSSPSLRPVRSFPFFLVIFFLRRGSWRRSSSPAGNWDACSALICRSLRMEPASHLSAANPSMRSLHGEGLPPYTTASAFHLQRPALLFLDRTAVAPASLAQTLH
jgi:hypothetical protein